MKQVLIIFILGAISLGTTLSIPYKKTIEKWTEIEGHPQTDYSSSFGYFFEFAISYNMNKNFFLSSGLNYNSTSIEINDKIGLFENKGKLSTSYLNIPLLIGFRPIDNLPISVSVGPYMGFIMQAAENGTRHIDTAGFVPVESEPDPVLQSIEPKKEYDTDIKEDYKTLDYGLSVQFDFEFRLSQKLKGVILTRFNYGLTNVLTNDLINNSSAEEWKNYNLMIGFGFKL